VPRRAHKHEHVSVSGMWRKRKKAKGRDRARNATVVRRDGEPRGAGKVRGSTAPRRKRSEERRANVLHVRRALR